VTNPIRFGAVVRLLGLREAHTRVKEWHFRKKVEAREACRANKAEE